MFFSNFIDRVSELFASVAVLVLELGYSDQRVDFRICLDAEVEAAGVRRDSSYVLSPIHMLVTMLIIGGGL